MTLAGEDNDARRKEYFDAVEARAEAARIANPFEHEDKLGKFILWNPEAPVPPRMIQATRAEAQRVAQLMADRHNGEFFVCRLESIHKEFNGHIINKAML